MAILFLDSFSAYSTADLPTRWKGAAFQCSIVNTVLPPGAQVGAQVLSNDGGAGGFVVGDNYGAKTQMTMACRYYRASTSEVGYVMGFANPSGVGSWSTPCHIKIDGSGTTIWSGDSGGEILLGSGPVIPAQEWHHLELDVTFGLAGTATINLYLDGNPTPFIHLTGVSTATSAATTFFLGQPPSATSGATAKGYFSGFYSFDNTGAAVFNAPLAPQGFGAPDIAFAVPSGPGHLSAWTPNGAATIWQCINQIPQDGDTTYASDATPGDAYMVTFGALPAMQTLLAVQLSVYAREDDAGPRSYQSGFSNGTTDGYSGVDKYLGGTYNYIQDEFPLNPVTGLAWSPGDLATLQFGAKLTN